MSTGRTWFAVLGALLTITAPAYGAASIYTSLKEEECHVAPLAISEAYDAEGTTAPHQKGGGCLCILLTRDHG